MSAKFTEEEIAKRAGVSLQELDQDYSDDITRGLAELCSQWRLTGEHLQLPEDQLSAIDGDKKSVEEKRIAVLKAKGQDLGGTYLVLVKAFKFSYETS